MASLTFVVGRDALGDVPAAPPTRKPAHDLLSRSNLRKGAIPLRIEIDLKGLVMGIDGFCCHLRGRVESMLCKMD
jgi:hypothetical protein